MGGGPGAGGGARLRSLEKWQVGVAVGCGVEPGRGSFWELSFNLKFECGGSELLRGYVALVSRVGKRF